MNGRIYDPELGRMLSPDPYVQVPEYSQNFNRYSYVLNNPLNKTDPTGYSWVSKVFGGAAFKWVKENWRTVAGIALRAILMLTPGGQFLVAGMVGAMLGGAATATAITIAGTAVTFGQIAAGTIIGGIMGATNAALAGGDLGDVLRGAAIGAIQGAISSGPLHALEGAANIGGKLAHVVGHGVTGGAANVAMGGKFQDGFLSAAASAAAVHTGLTSTAQGSTGEAIGMAGRTAASAIIGGTASALGGGKFANGAYTSAFQHLLNSESLDQLEKWAQRKEYLWSVEQRNRIIKYYQTQGLDYSNREIDATKKWLFTDDSVRKMLATEAIGQIEYERIFANKFQTLMAANIAAASMDPNWEFGPAINITCTVGYGFGTGSQIGFAADNNSIKIFYGKGFSSKGLIASFGVGKGNAPNVGQSTTSLNGALFGLGAGRENAGWSVQFSTPGVNVMKNNYLFEFK